jgi:hypothetical protein
MKISNQPAIIENTVKQVESGESMEVTPNGRLCRKFLTILMAFILISMASGSVYQGNDLTEYSTMAYHPFNPPFVVLVFCEN